MDIANKDTVAQMVIDIQDYAIVKDLKHLLTRISGVGKISVRKNYYESEEFYKDIDEAEKDIANGKGIRIDNAESLNALFQ